MGPGALWVSVVVVCLLGAARCSPDDKKTCPCPEIPSRPDTLPPPRECFPVDHRFRYVCVEGKVRKAGTSSLIRCTQENDKVSWTDATLECIDDPKRPKPTQGELTSTHTPSPHDIMTTIISSTISASTSTQMTPSKSFSPSELIRTTSTESTTVADHSQESVTTTPTDRTTASSATTGASISTAHAPRYAGKEAAAGISCVSLVIICALIGLSLYFVRRRKRQNLSQEKPEEQVAINCINGLPE